MTDMTLDHTPAVDETAEPTTEEAALFAGKYHSVEALEQGYKELSKLVRHKPEDVPESYTFDFQEDPTLAGVEIPPDDALLGHMSDTMRELGLSQKQADGLVRAFLHHQVNSRTVAAEELVSLGAEGEAMLGRVGRFLGRHFDEGERSVLESLATTTAGVKMLDKFVRLAGEKPIPSQVHHAPVNADALKQKAFSLMKEKDFSWNENKQAAYDRIWRDIVEMEGK